MADKAAFNDTALNLASLFSVLGHPARVQILLHLANYQGCTAGSIANKLPLAKSTISEHLRKLKQAGLVISTPSGACIKYHLKDDVIADLKTDVHGFSKRIELLQEDRLTCNLLGNFECCPYKTE